YLDQKQYPWYDISKLPAIEAVDLLVIDGPPDHRYPALPMLHHLLSNEAVIVCDDAKRAIAQENVRRWLSEVPVLGAQYVALDTRALVLTSGAVRIPPLALTFPAGRGPSSADQSRGRGIVAGFPRDT